MEKMENLWKILRDRVYANGGFRDFTSLKRRVNECWREIDPQKLRNLSHSMVRRCTLLRQNPSKKLPY